MPEAFGPRKPLFGPYTYRAKQNSNGDTLIAVYVGSKRIAHMDAYWMYSMRSVEDREEEVKQRGRGMSCATDLRALGAEGKYPNVLGVSHAFITDDAHKGKGVGRAMYEAMMVEGFAVRESRTGGKPGPMFFIPDECKGVGNTSAEARRVWASLVRDYPSAGTSIRVDAPPVIGSRAPRANPRRRNPETVLTEKRNGVLVEREGGYLYAARKGSTLHVTTVELPESVRGRGHGISMYERLFDYGKKNGFTVVSDSTVELPAARVWEAMARRGHPVVRHPSAILLSSANGDIDFWYVKGGNVQTPVFSVARAPRRNPDAVAGLGLDALAEDFTEKMANGTTAQMRRWAKKHGLTYVGEGESRAVFGHATEPVVIKFVFSSYGQEANQNEARAWREASPNIRKHLVPIVAADPAGRWLVMERVKPMRATQYAEKAALTDLQGCGFLDFGRPNFSSDGRMLDYGQHLWFRWSEECRGTSNPRQTRSATVPRAEGRSRVEGRMATRPSALRAFREALAATGMRSNPAAKGATRRVKSDTLPDALLEMSRRFLLVDPKDVTDEDLVAVLLAGAVEGDPSAAATELLVDVQGNLARVARAEGFARRAGFSALAQARMSAAAELVKRAERRASVEGLGEKVTGPAEAERIARAYIGGPREQVGALFFDSQLRLLGFRLLSMGGQTMTVADPREVVISALEMRATAVILVHNHPSGVPSPSGPDDTTTTRLKEILRLLGMTLADHIILGKSGDTYSYAMSARLNPRRRNPAPASEALAASRENRSTGRTYFHVTTIDGANAILRDGFRAGPGICGHGVYLWDDLWHAQEMAYDVGEDAVILAVNPEDTRLYACEETDTQSEGDSEYYEHVVIARVKSAWKPKMRVLE
jgi:DNA repair protein RadC